MLYACHTPSYPLNSYIYDLYYLEGPVSYTRLKTFPIPSLNLMVNFGHPFSVRRSDQAQPLAVCRRSWGVGVFSTYHVVDWPPSVRFFGVHFKPGGAAPFFPLPLSELHNQVVELDAIWGCFADEVRERLHDAPTIEEGFALFEQLLLARFSHMSRGWGLVQHAIEEIVNRHGDLSIRELSEQIGISQNHLKTQFKQLIGASPKEFARLSRFFHVLSSIDPMQPVDWTLIAHQSGFYDQPHFNKEFAAFTGYSPSRYLLLRRRCCAQDPQQGQSLGQMPID
ncbi:helix-turn-helix domain-containing protein [Ktedonosporobacter rubrisoli]|nr:helix-turn-helix domain-containing protein [Ktedonosporobacter rubrisoli]